MPPSMPSDFMPGKQNPFVLRSQPAASDIEQLGDHTVANVTSSVIATREEALHFAEPIDTIKQHDRSRTIITSIRSRPSNSSTNSLASYTYQPPALSTTQRLLWTSQTSAMRRRTCWRCRKYKKACDDSNPCHSCSTSGFRVWPSSVGCRRDTLEAFTGLILPRSTEQNLAPLLSSGIKFKNWRTYEDLPALNLTAHTNSRHYDLISQIYASGMYGDELVELICIAESYQVRITSQDTLLDTAVKVMRASFRLYNTLVSKSSAQTWNSTERISNVEVLARVRTIAEIRLSLRKGLVQFHAYSLSQKRRDWFPAILGMAILASSITVILDVAFTIPEPLRSTIWGSDIVGTCMQIREQMYGIVLDLLRVKDHTDETEGPRPLQLTCWTIIEANLSTGPNLEDESAKIEAFNQQRHVFADMVQSEAGNGPTTQTFTEVDARPDAQRLKLPAVWQRNSTGLHLVDNDERAFDGFVDFQRWMRKHYSKLSPGTFVMSFPAYSLPSIPPISILARLFGL